MIMIQKMDHQLVALMAADTKNTYKESYYSNWQCGMSISKLEYL